MSKTISDGMFIIVEADEMGNDVKHYYGKVSNS
jgi:hypothetical protein